MAQQRKRTALTIRQLESRQVLSGEMGSSSFEVGALRLLTDNGESATDKISSVGTILGQVSGLQAGSQVSVQIDFDGDAAVDATIGTERPGSQLSTFTFNPTSYYQLKEAGQQTFSFRAVEQSGGLTKFSGWKEFTYTLADSQSGSLNLSSNADTVTFSLGSLKSGIAGIASTLREGFVLLSSESVHSRFEGVHSGNSDTLMAVRFDTETSQWQYANKRDNSWEEFAVRSSDRLIGRIDFQTGAVDGLSGVSTEINGIAAGYLSTDLSFVSNSWGGVPTPGSYQVIGTSISLSPVVSNDPTIIRTGNVRSGVAIDDSNTSFAYIMYSQENVHQRFSAHAPKTGNSDHFIGVRFNETERSWEYSDDSTTWYRFATRSTDRLVAQIDYGAGAVRSFKGVMGEFSGLAQGYTDGDLEFILHSWNNTVDLNEVQVKGTGFTLRSAVQEIAPTKLRFADTFLGSQTTRTVTVQNTGASSISLLQVLVPFGYEASGFQSTTLAPGASYSFNVSLLGLDVGEIAGDLGILTMSGGVSSVKSFELTGEVFTPRLSVSLADGVDRNVLDFGVLSSGQILERDITVKNTGTAAVALSARLALPRGFSIVGLSDSFTLAAGQSMNIRVRIDGSDNTVRSGNLEFYALGQSSPFSSVALRAEVNVPRLEVAIGAAPFNSHGGDVDFGVVLGNATAQRTLTLKNTGTQPLNISSIELPDGLAIIGGFTPITLAAGESRALELQLAAANGTSLTPNAQGRIVILSNDPSDPLFAVTTRGAVLSVLSGQLLNDNGYSQYDGVTSDPRVAFSLSTSVIQFQVGQVRAEIDLDNDQIVDRVVDVLSSRFDFDPNLQNSGAFSGSVRFLIGGQTSSWTAYSGYYDPAVTDLAPVITSVSLENETDYNRSPNPLIVGTVVNDGSSAGLRVSVDINGDGNADATTVVRDDGTFLFDASSLALGVHTVKFRAEENPYKGAALASNWQSITFEKIPYPAPAILNVALKDDTGASDSDNVTSVSAIVGSIDKQGPAGRYKVAWDTRADGDFTSSTAVDASGNFELVPSRLTVGSVTLYLKAIDTTTGATSAAQSFSFQLESMAVPAILAFGLQNDTGAQDGITSVSTLTGAISSEWGVANQKIEFDWTGDGKVDGTTLTSITGDFSFSLEKVAFGAITVAARTAIYDLVTGTQIVGGWQSLSFVYQKSLAVSIANLQLSNADSANSASKPILTGTASENNVASAFTEIEFDYNGDGISEASLIADENGQFSHFADTIQGQVTVRARARQLDNANGQYYYGAWSAVTFTRTLGPVVSTNQTAEQMTRESQANSVAIADAIRRAATQLSVGFNGSSYGTGMGLGHVRVNIATLGDVFATNGEQSSTLRGEDQGASSTIIVGTGLAASGSRQGTVATQLGTSVFEVTASLSYTLNRNAGTTTFSYSGTVLLLNKNSTNVAYTVLVAGTFTSDANGTFSFLESVNVQGTRASDSSHQVNVQSNLAINGGTVSANGNTSYGFSRTTVVNNQTSLNHARYGDVGTSAIALAGTYTEAGTSQSSLSGPTARSKSVSKSYTSTFGSDVDSVDQINRDGASGSRQNDDGQSYSVNRNETMNYVDNNGSWTFTGGTFTETVSGSTSTDTSSGGTVASRESSVGANLGSTGASVSSPGINTSSTFNASSSVSESYTAYISATVTVGLYGIITTTANFSASGSQRFRYTVSMSGNTTSSIGDTTLTYGYSGNAVLSGNSSFTISGSYTESGTSFSGYATGNQSYSVSLNGSGSSTSTATSPTITSSSSSSGTLQTTYSSGSTFMYTVGASGSSTSGSYNINLNTTSTGNSSSGVTYTDHRIDGGTTEFSGLLNGSESSTFQGTTTFVLTENGNFSYGNSGSQISGTFDKTSTGSSLDGGSSNLTYTRDSGSTTLTSSDSSTSSSNATDNGSFSFGFGGGYMISSMAGNGGMYGSSVITGNYTNTGSTSGTSSYGLSTTDSWNSVSGSNTSSNSVSTTTTYTANSQDNGNYSVTNGQRSGSGNYTDTSSSNSTTTTSDSNSYMYSEYGVILASVGVGGTWGGSNSSTQTVNTISTVNESGNYVETYVDTLVTGTTVSTSTTIGNGTSTSTSASNSATYFGFNTDTSTTQFTSTINETGNSSTLTPKNPYGQYLSTRSGNYTATSTSQTVSSGSRGSGGTNYGVTTSSSDSYTSTNNTITTDNGSYTLNSNGSGSRIIDTTTTTTASSTTSGSSSSSYTSPSGASAGNSWSVSSSGNGSNQAGGTIQSTTTIVYAIGGWATTSVIGSYSENARSSMTVNSNSNSSTWWTHSGISFGEVDSGTTVVQSTSNVQSAGAFQESGGINIRTGNRTLQRSSQSRNTDTSTSGSSGPNGSSLSVSNTVMTSRTSYNETGNQIEVNDVVMLATGSHNETSNTSNTVSSRSSSSYVTPSSAGSSRSRSQSRSNTNTFNSGTYNNTNTTYNIVNNYNSASNTISQGTSNSNSIHVTADRTEWTTSRSSQTSVTSDSESGTENSASGGNSYTSNSSSASGSVGTGTSRTDFVTSNSNGYTTTTTTSSSSDGDSSSASGTDTTSSESYGYYATGNTTSNGNWFETITTSGGYGMELSIAVGTVSGNIGSSTTTKGGTKNTSEVYTESGGGSVSTGSGGGTYSSSSSSNITSVNATTSYETNTSSYNYSVDATAFGVTGSHSYSGGSSSGDRRWSSTVTQANSAHSASGAGSGYIIPESDYSSYSNSTTLTTNAGNASRGSSWSQSITSLTYTQSSGGGGSSPPSGGPGLVEVVEIEELPGPSGYSSQSNTSSRWEDSTNVRVVVTTTSTAPSNFTITNTETSSKTSETYSDYSGYQSLGVMLAWSGHDWDKNTKTKTIRADGSRVYSKNGSASWHRYARFAIGPDLNIGDSGSYSSSSDDGSFLGWLTGIEGWWDEYGGAILDWVQFGLDWLGMLPVIGSAFDIVNAGISLARGDYLGAALNLAGAIPGIGDAATAAKLAGKAAGAVGALGKAGGAVGKLAGGAVSVGSQALGMAGNAAKRAGNAIGSAIMSGAKKLDNIKCKFTGNCFVGDTKVLVFENVPSVVAASFIPIPLAAGTDIVGNSSVSAWLALTTAGVVIVLAKKKQKKHSQASLIFNEESPTVEPTSIPVLTNEQLDALQLTGTYSPNTTGSATLVSRSVEAGTASSTDKASLMEKASLIEKAGSNGELADLEPMAVTCPASPVYEDWSSIDEDGSKFGTIGFRTAMVAAVLAMCVWLAGLWRDSRPIQSQSSIPTLHSAALVDSKSDASHSTLALATPDRASLPDDVRITTRQISDIQVGMRVPAFNPQRSADQGANEATAVDPKTWRVFGLELQKEDGSKLDLKLLRPASWLVDEQAKTDSMLVQALIEEAEAAESELSDEAAEVLTTLQDEQASSALSQTSNVISRSGSIASASLGYMNEVWQNEILAARELESVREQEITSVLYGDGVGSEIYLTMPELGAVGLAKVVSITPSPLVSEGPGEVVTGTFRHGSAQVLDLRFEASGSFSSPSAKLASTSVVQTYTSLTPSNSSLTLGVTAAHPFWSVDREDFVPAGELRLYERVVAINGREFRLTSITPRAGPETVYNFEVANEHVYYVGDDGILVHNLYIHHSRLLGQALASKNLAKAFRKAKYQAAHIVPTGKWTGRSAAVQAAVANAQANMAKYGVGLNSVSNGFWAKAGHMGSHTDRYLLAMGKIIGDAKSKREILNGLQDLRRMLEQGKFLGKP